MEPSFDELIRHALDLHGSIAVQAVLQLLSTSRSKVRIDANEWGTFVKLSAIKVRKKATSSPIASASTALSSTPNTSPTIRRGHARDEAIQSDSCDDFPSCVPPGLPGLPWPSSELPVKNTFIHLDMQEHNSDNCVRSSPGRLEEQPVLQQFYYGECLADASTQTLAGCPATSRYTQTDVADSPHVAMQELQSDSKAVTDSIYSKTLDNSLDDDSELDDCGKATELNKIEEVKLESLLKRFEDIVDQKLCTLDSKVNKKFEHYGVG